MIVSLDDDASVSILRPESGKAQTYYWDNKFAGFGCRVSAKGRIQFIVRTSVGGVQKKYTIGPHSSWTLAEAKRKAFELISGTRVEDNAATEDHDNANDDSAGRVVSLRIVAVHDNGTQKIISECPLDIVDVEINGTKYGSDTDEILPGAVF